MKRSSVRFSTCFSLESLATCEEGTSIVGYAKRYKVLIIGTSGYESAFNPDGVFRQRFIQMFSCCPTFFKSLYMNSPPMLGTRLPYLLLIPSNVRRHRPFRTYSGRAQEGFSCLSFSSRSLLFFLLDLQSPRSEHLE